MSVRNRSIVEVLGRPIRWKNDPSVDCMLRTAIRQRLSVGYAFPSDVAVGAPAWYVVLGLVFVDSCHC